MSIHNENTQLLFLLLFVAQKKFSKFDKLLAGMLTKVHLYRKFIFLFIFRVLESFQGS